MSKANAVSPVWALVALFLGLAGMLETARFASALLGTRPGLLFAEAALVVPALLALVAKRLSFTDSLGLRSPGVHVFRMSLLAGAALWGASLGLFEVQSYLWPPAEDFLEAFQRLHESLRPSGILDGLFSVAAIAIVPAACEETLFRGVILPSFAAPWGSTIGVLGSAALFGLIHVMPISPHEVSFYRVPFAFTVGVGLGLLRTATGVLWPSFLAHATLNTITFLAAIPLMSQDLTLTPAADPLLPAGPPLLLAGAFAFWWVLRRMNLDLAKGHA